MEICVVQPGDDINSIAGRYGVSADKLILDNELEDPEELVAGQTLVVVHPKQAHTVQEGDTLTGIAGIYGVTVMQLLRNNPFLSNREYIYPGETIVISYDTIDSITVHGFCYPFINHGTLVKTLPHLTYLSIFNYRVTGEGELTAYSEEDEVIRLAKTYGTVPLMMTTTLTPQGEPDIEADYNILLGEKYQERYISNILNIIKSKGYYGLNLIISYINTTNQILYQDFIRKVSDRLNQEGYLIFVTINPNVKNTDDEAVFEKIDYEGISRAVDEIIFLQFVWGTNTDSPGPVSSIKNIRAFVDYAVSVVSPDKIIIGKPIISYDWALPYVSEKSAAFSMTLNSALSLAHDVGASLQFDEASQTPFFEYYQYGLGTPTTHIVWLIDARSLDVINKLVSEYRLLGTGVWNIMVYIAQMWLVTVSQFDIVKVLPVQ